MKLLFINLHPVDPQVVRFLAKELVKKGDEILFATIEKENIISKIISSYNFENIHIGSTKTTYFSKLLNIFTLEKRLFLLLIKFKPDIVFSPCSPHVGLLTKLLNIPYIAWGDTETAILNAKISFPLINTILTPSCFSKPVPKNKHIAFEGYKEMAYLHPNWFNPNPNVLEKLSLSINDKIVLLRFSALKASHDIGLKSHGEYSKEKILAYINKLEGYAKVFISMSERDLGPEFKQYKLEIKPHEYTNFLSYCSLYVGEGTTTASEAGVLGVPWINIQKTTRGYLIEQEVKYGLGFRTDDIDYAFKTAIDWIKKDNLKEEWKIKQKKLLSEKIDVSSFLIWFIENYPESHKIMINNPEFQNNFK